MNIIFQNTNTDESVKVLLNNVAPNIATDWSSFIVLLLKKDGSIALKWNWQSDGGVLADHIEATLGNDVNEIILPFSKADTVNLQLTNYNLKLKYTTIAGKSDETAELQNAFQVTNSPAKNMDTE